MEGRSCVAADRAIRIWDVTTWKETVPLRGLYRPITAISYSPDSKRVAFGDGTRIRLDDAATLAELRRLSGVRASVITSCSLRTGRSWGLSCPGARSRDGCRHWKTAVQGAGEPRKPHGIDGMDSLLSPGLGTYVIWHRPVRDGRRGYLIEEKFDVYVRDAKTGKDVLKFRRAEGLDVGARRQLLGDPLFGKTQGNGSKAEGGVNSAAFSAGGNLIAFACEGGGVFIWDVRTGKQVWKSSDELPGARQIKFSRDGKTLIAAGIERELYVWELATARRLRIPAGEWHRFASSADGRVLASWTGDGPIVLWNSGTGEELARIAGHEGGVSQVAFTPDGSTLTTGGEARHSLVLGHQENP